MEHAQGDDDAHQTSVRDRLRLKLLSRRPEAIKHLNTQSTAETSSAIQSTDNVDISPNQESTQPLINSNNIQASAAIYDSDDDEQLQQLCSLLQKDYPVTSSVSESLSQAVSTTTVSAQLHNIGPEATASSDDRAKKKAFPKAFVESKVNRLGLKRSLFKALTSSQSEHNDVEHNDEKLKQILPAEDMYQYKVVLLTSDASSGTSFSALFCVNLNSREDFNEWKKNLEKKTLTQFNIIETRRVLGKRVIFKQYLKCHHDVERGTTGARKHTACPARLTVHIKAPFSVNQRKKSVKSGQQMDPDLQCEIALSWNHNHPIDAADVLRHHSVTSETCRKLIDLYKNGHSPSSALAVIKTDIEDNIQDGDRLEQLLANRSICPDDQQCHYILRKLFRSEYGNPHDNLQFVDFVTKINAEVGDKVVAYEDFESKCQPYAICTPFMKRVHQHIQEAGELVFIDSSGGFDRDGYQIFMLITHSKAGGLPLAVGITPSESTDALTRLFALVKMLLPSGCFYQRGRDHGPQLLMTDDSAAEQAALNNIWPHTKQLLCQFHVLQAQWRWLLESHHGITRADRPKLYQFVKKIMYAQTTVKTIAEYKLFLASTLVSTYPAFQDQIGTLYAKKEKWCSSFRSGELVRGNHTNNYVESSMRVLKDQIFKRTRAFNLTQMTHFIVERLSSYYERRLLDFANNRQLRNPNRFPEYDGQRIDLISDDIYEVESSRKDGTLYTVDISACMCTCFDGSTGKLCKHVHFVRTQLHIDCSTNYHFSDDRRLAFFVACGTEPPAGWLDSLHGGPVTHAPIVRMNTDISASQDSEDHSTSSDNHEDLQALVAVQSEFAELWKDKVERKAIKNPKQWISAYSCAVAALKRVNTENAALSMVHTVGRYHENGQPSSKKRKLGNIPVQTTSVARRKKCLRGRAPGKAGRPRKDTVLVSNKHDYTMPSRKFGAAASHNLSSCVRKNVSLGRTHSRK